MTDNFDLRKFLSENKLTKASKILNENYLELQTDDTYNYTTISAKAVGPSKIRVTLHQEDLYGEPDIKKVVNMSFDEFVEKLKAAGAEEDPTTPNIFFDMNSDATEDLLRTLGFDL